MLAYAVIATAVAVSLAGTPAVANGAVEIRLPGNPSTGYQWHLDAEASAGLDRVEVTVPGYGPPESDLLGAPAPFRFLITCKGPGEVLLQFSYVSPSGQTVSKHASHAMTCD